MNTESLPSVPHLTIHFRGRDAENHRMRMRDLGHSLVGIERIITAGMFALENGTFPKSNEKLPFVVHTYSPRRGSIELATLLVSTELLPIFYQLYLSKAGDILWNWMSAVMLGLGGRRRDADRHLDKVFDLVRHVSDQRHIEVMEFHKLAHASRNAVRPIGHSCDKMVLRGSGSDQRTEIDTPIADAIRSTLDYEVSDMERIRITVNGFTHHDRQLKIVDPDDPSRFIVAVVRDPAFDITPNIYTNAASYRSELDVSAKRMIRGGRNHKLYIMDAKHVEGPGPADRGKSGMGGDHPRSRAATKG